MGWLESVERTVQREADRNPKKLRQVGMQYDIAHAKAGVLDEDAEQERMKEKIKRKSKEQKRKQEKMNEMRDAMAKMQTALFDMTKQVEQKEQKKDKDRSKDKDKEKDREDIDVGLTELEEPAKVKEGRKDELTAEDTKLPPGFWPGDSFKTGHPPGAGELATKDDNRSDNQTQSRSTQTRDSPPQPEPEPEPADPEPGTSPTSKPSLLDEPVKPAKDESLSSGSDSDSSDSDSDSDSSSDASSVLSLPSPPERNPPWNPVCVMCLRVYAQDKEVSVKLVGKELGEGTVAEAEIVKENEKAALEDEAGENKNGVKEGDEKKGQNKEELLKVIEEAQEKFKIILASGKT